MSKKDRINEIINESQKEAVKEKSKIVKDFLVIDADSNYFAFQLEYLREVFELTNKNDIVPVPFTPDYIIGIINVRDEIIPAISILKLLGYEENNTSYKKVAIIEDEFKIAVPFMDIIDLKIIDINKIRHVKNASKKATEHFLTQEFEFENKTICIIDILKLFSSEYLK